MATTRIKLRRGTQSEWASNSSIVLASGEPGYDTSNRILKIGDGATAWSSLNSISMSGALNLPAGNTSSAPVKFQSGSLLTSITAGAMEFLSGTLYFTPSTIRKTIAFLDSDITGTSTGIAGSQTGNYVYASPNGASGVGSFRSLVSSDLPVVPTTKGGTNLTSFTNNGAIYANSTSTLTSGTLPAASGGTGNSTYVAGDILYASGANALSRLPIPIPSTSGLFLTLNNGLPTWTATPLFSSNATFNGDIFINGGDIFTSALTTTIFNSNTTNLSIGGAASTLKLGHTGTGSSTTNIVEGATGQALIKTINIGPNGATGSFTNINIGSILGTSTVKINGSLSSPIVTTPLLNGPRFSSNSYSTTQTLTIANDIVFLTASAAWTLTLPPPSAGKILYLIRTDATAFILSVSGNINGSATTNTSWFSASAVNTRVTLASNGASWYAVTSGSLI